MKACGSRAIGSPYSPKYSCPSHSLPEPKARPYPTSRKVQTPMQRSAKFLMRMFVTFLERMEPASSMPKPAWWGMASWSEREGADLEDTDDAAHAQDEEGVKIVPEVE